LKDLSIKPRVTQGHLFSSLLLNIPEVLARAIRQEKEIKGIQSGKKDLFGDYIILYINILCNKKIFHQKLLELIN
jgi:hypothetical protein